MYICRKKLKIANFFDLAFYDGRVSSNMSGIEITTGDL